MVFSHLEDQTMERFHLAVWSLRTPSLVIIGSRSEGMLSGGGSQSECHPGQSRTPSFKWWRFKPTGIKHRLELTMTKLPMGSTETGKGARYSSPDFLHTEVPLKLEHSLQQTNRGQTPNGYVRVKCKQCYRKTASTIADKPGTGTWFEQGPLFSLEFAGRAGWWICTMFGEIGGDKIQILTVSKFAQHRPVTSC